LITFLGVFSGFIEPDSEYARIGIAASSPETIINPRLSLI
jgi:hypothetical protein